MNKVFNVKEKNAMISWKFENRFNSHAKVVTSPKPKYKMYTFPSK